MTSSKYKRFCGLAVLPLAVLAIAGCGGAAPASPPKTADGLPATVGVTTTGLGTTLVDSGGRTLYLFEKDSGERSACSGACAEAWPPLPVNGEPQAGTGVNASRIGTIVRSDGAAQLTYNGHPLYLYAGDRKAGDTNGQGVDAFGAEWYALSPAGDQITHQSSDDESSAAGGGYGAY